jgi:hypothetical protein
MIKVNDESEYGRFGSEYGRFGSEYGKNDRQKFWRKI